MKTTKSSVPIVSARLLPIYGAGRDAGKIVGVSAIVTGCPSCGHRHSHAVKATPDGGDSLVTKDGLLKRQTAPCGASYCVEASTAERAAINAAIRRNKAWWEDQIAKQREEARLARLRMQQNLADGLWRYERTHAGR